MNSRNLQIKGAKTIGLPRLWPHVEDYPSNLFHGRNQRKTPQIVKSKINPKIPLKIMKKINMTAQGRR
jgi:hypothetical protein